MDTTVNELIGRRIRRELDRRGLSQKDLAEKLFVTPQAVSQWISGKYRPDEEYRKGIRDVLGINVNDIVYNTEDHGETKMNVTPLEQITDLDTLHDAVEEILNNCQYFIDQTYAHSITEMLRRMLYLVIGYETYYAEIAHLHTHDGPAPDDPVDWSWIGDDIREMLMSEKKFAFPMPIGFNLSSFPFRSPGFLLSNQIEWMAYKIGGELFEEGAEHESPEYLISLGSKGELSGEILNSMLPDRENTLVTMFKIALFGLVRVLQHC